MTREELKTWILYDKDTGKFFWIYNKSRRKEFISKFVGKEAGHLSKTSGYISIKINNIVDFAHRWAFLYEFGYIPKYVDHINRKRDDNRIENLRDVSAIVNGRNCNISTNNKSGFTGVHFDTKRKKWVATITVNRKMIHLGRFNAKEEAIKAREEGEIKYGFK